MVMQIARALGLCLAVGVVGACTGLAPIRVPPPADVHEQAIIPGLPEARFWGDDYSDLLVRGEIERIDASLRERWERAGRPADGVPINALALSGGGPDGAFAAGLLNGWSETGTRPEFDLVTGISVGALIAPFAFLGPDYDHALRTIFTEFGAEDVAVFAPFAALGGALGLLDTQPLRRTIRDLIDAPTVEAIAAESRAGRRLLIGTTNIDAARPVIWDMGAIAEAGEVELFGDVMLASASIPGAFPPVLIDVEAGGRSFSEFHVDGGVTHSVILWPTGVERVFPRIPGVAQRGTIHVIQNNQLRPPFTPVDPRLSQIAARSLSTLIRAQTSADLAQIYNAAQAVGYDFRLIFVPPSATAPGTTDFDRAYMTALFEQAETLGRGSIPWFEAPPAAMGRAELSRRLAELAAMR